MDAAPSQWMQAIVYVHQLHRDIAEWDLERLWDHRLPEVAATEDRLRIVEAGLGHAIDPQYRAFLRHADGWVHFYQDATIFGSSALLGGWPFARARAEVERFCAPPAASTPAVSSEGLLPVAFDAEDGGLWAMVRPGRERAGQVIWFNPAGRVVSQFDDFESFFASMSELTRRELEHLKGEHSGRT